MTKEIAVQESKAMTYSDYGNEYTGDAEIEAKDLIIPKFLVMQGLSQAVSDGKAVLGEIRDSLENKLFGGKDKTFEFIPLHHYKTWIVFTEEKGKLEYTAQVPYTAENADWEWNTTIDGKKVRRDQAINIYAILPNEIKDGIFMPYLISYRRTSYSAGKQMLTNLQKMKLANRPWFTKTFKLGSKQEKNDQGSYYVYTNEMGRDTKPEEIEAIKPWLLMLKSQAVKVDDSDLETERVQTTHIVQGTDDEMPF